MVMYDLCVKIDWAHTRKLENGQTVGTGCEVKEKFSLLNS